MPETNLFLSLEDITWQIEELKELLSSINKYNFELIFGSFSNMPEVHCEDIILDEYGMSLSDYQNLVRIGLSDIMEKNHLEIQEKEATLTSLLRRQGNLIAGISYLSNLSKTELLFLADKFHLNVSDYDLINQAYERQRRIPIYQYQLSLPLNPLLADFLNSEVLDFVKCLINARYNYLDVDIEELYQDYLEQTIILS